RTGTKKKTLKGEGILAHLGMVTLQTDQFTQAPIWQSRIGTHCLRDSDRRHWNTTDLAQADTRARSHSRHSFGSRETPRAEIRSSYGFVRDSSALSRLQRVDGKEACAPRYEW